MATYGNSSTWCLCDKLPRSILHVAPNPDVWCKVCGKRRRPRACVTSSSDEEELAAELRQKQLKEQRHAEEEKEVSQCSVRVNVATNAKKPHFKIKPSNKKVLVGHIGQSDKPQGALPKCKATTEPVVQKVIQLDRKADSYTPTPPPSPSLSPAPSVSPAPTEESLLEAPKDDAPKLLAHPKESLWEKPKDDVPNLVALAHEVFNRPQHVRQRQLGLYDQFFVSDLIPLNKPITNVKSGAISKRRRRPFGRPLSHHFSRPLPPLSEIIKKKQQPQHERVKGGGLAHKRTEADAVSQFEPFDSYDGPSEDALVVESAWQVLQQPKSLQMTARDDLPSTQLSSFESEATSSDTSSSSAFQVPSAPQAEPKDYSLNVPLRLDKVMQSVAQSNPSDSSASSGTTSSRSSDRNLTLAPNRPESVHSRGADLPTYDGDRIGTEDLVTMEAGEGIVWSPAPNPAKLVESKESPTKDNDNQWDLDKDIEQIMGSINLTEAGDSDKNPIKNENDEDEELWRIFESPVPSSSANHFNDMSNELPVNSTNKSAGDANYFKSVSNGANRYKACRKHSAQHAKGDIVKAARQTIDKQSMWSVVSRLFVPVSVQTVEDELKPLKSDSKLQYGTIKPSNLSKSIETKQSCQKCGLYKKNSQTGNENHKPKPIHQNVKHKPSCIFHSPANSNTTMISSSINNNLFKNSLKIDSSNINQCKSGSNIIKLNPRNMYNSKTNCNTIKNKSSHICCTQKLENGNNAVRCFDIIPKNLPTAKQSSTSSTYNKPCYGRAKLFKEAAVSKPETALRNKKPGTSESKTSKGSTAQSTYFESCFESITPPVELSEEKEELNTRFEFNTDCKKILENSQKILKKADLQIKPTKYPRKNQFSSSKHQKDQLLNNKIEPEICSITDQSSTSSTYYETCFTISRNKKAPQSKCSKSQQFSICSSHFESCLTAPSIDLVEKIEKLEPKAWLENIKIDEQKQQKLKSFEQVRFASSELIMPKRVAIVKKSACFGLLRKYIINNGIVEEPLDTFEFQTPDVEAFAMIDTHNVINDPVAEKCESIITHSETSKHNDESSKRALYLEYKRSIHKKSILPAWPAHPSSQKKRRAKHKSMQISDQHLLIESKDKNAINNRKLETNNQMWTGKDVVQLKINDMMTKPIKLLNISQITAPQAT